MTMRHELTVREILLGNSERRVPDVVDVAVLNAYAEAGDAGLTSEDLCCRLLGRELTAAEANAVAFVDEIERLDREMTERDLALFNLILRGEVVDSGERRDGQICWTPAPKPKH